MAAHMEFPALLSLPAKEELDNATSDEVQSEQAKNSSCGDDNEPLPLSAEDWNEHNTLPEVTNVWISTIPLILEQWILEAWTEVTSAIHPPRVILADPGQDLVLLPFVERYRQIQTLQLQKRLGIPLLVVTDPEGLEVPDKKWSIYTGDPKLDTQFYPNPDQETYEVTVGEEVVEEMGAREPDVAISVKSSESMMDESERPRPQYEFVRRKKNSRCSEL